MIKFIIIEDDIKIQDQVKDIIRKATFSLKEEISILKYTKYNKSLEKEIKHCSERKIYIIDIKLEDNQSGINIAKFIRDFDWESEIVFITNHDKMFETVYRTVYEVFDFIEKFHDFDKRLEKDLNIILRRNFDNKMFTYCGRNVDLHIYLKNILYIYRDKEERKDVIVTDCNKFTVRLGIQEILEKLDERFKMVHRACIVNKNRVHAYNWTEKSFTLDNGEKVGMLSKKFKKGVDSK